MYSKTAPGQYLYLLFLFVAVLNIAAGHAELNVKLQCTTYFTRHKIFSSVLQITVVVTA
jgi:hypothetical protein